jgi:hypothetical protein
MDRFSDADVTRIQAMKHAIDSLADELEAIANKYPAGEDKEDALLAVASLRKVDNPLRSFT